MIQPHDDRAMRWRKSSRSQEHGACVELAPLQGVIAVRDSTDPDGPILSFRRSVWRVFAAEVKASD